MVDVAKQHRSVGASVKRDSKATSDKGSNYFDVVRSLTQDPELKKAADEAQAELRRKAK